MTISVDCVDDHRTDEITSAIYYTVHHNWDYVLSNGKIFREHKCDNIHKCNRMRELPSQIMDAKDSNRGVKLKPTYSLFRFDYVSSQQEQQPLILSTVASCDSFMFLDAKDSLYKHLDSVGGAKLMPVTQLISWDWTNTLDSNTDSLISFPSIPSLLKAACGSGGFGLYFVYSVADIKKVIDVHMQRAINSDNFITSLEKQYGSVPSWSLQQYIHSYRVPTTGKRCQLRVYAVMLTRSATGACSTDLANVSSCYIYTDVECRVPSWDCDLDAAITLVSGKYSSDAISCCSSNDDNDKVRDNTESIDTAAADAANSVEMLENGICSDTTVRPYNRDRNKSDTDRHLLSEIPGVTDSVNQKVLKYAHEALLRLKPLLLNAVKTSTVAVLPSSSKLSIAGIDLMLDSDMNVYIVELNYNPAFPSEKKRMSDAYRQHLFAFSDSLIRLGLNNGADSDTLHFNKIF